MLFSNMILTLLHYPDLMFKVTVFDLSKKKKNCLLIFLRVILTLTILILGISKSHLNVMGLDIC